MPRELGDERERYGRKSWREQVADLLAWPREHRFAAGVLVIVIAGALLLASVRGRHVDLGDLAVGDCLYVPTAAARDGAPNERPIGESEAVVAVVLEGGAQRAACDASHGHEVSAVFIDPAPSRAVGEIGTVLDAAVLRALAEPQCDAAFSGYVGRSLAGSRYATFPVLPEPEEWLRGGRRIVCLVARIDGQWMDRPARASAQ